jgi:hypothetical protein
LPTDFALQAEDFESGLFNPPQLLHFTKYQGKKHLGPYGTPSASSVDFCLGERWKGRVKRAQKRNAFSSFEEIAEASASCHFP